MSARAKDLDITVTPMQIAQILKVVSRANARMAGPGTVLVAQVLTSIHIYFTVQRTLNLRKERRY